MFRYFPVAESQEEKIGYGIAGFELAGEQWRKCVFTLCPAPDFHTADVLALRCTGHQLDPVHLTEVIEDFFGE